MGGELESVSYVNFGASSRGMEMYFPQDLEISMPQVWLKPLAGLSFLSVSFY